MRDVYPICVGSVNSPEGRKWSKHKWNEAETCDVVSWQCLISARDQARYAESAGSAARCPGGASDHSLVP